MLSAGALDLRTLLEVVGLMIAEPFEACIDGGGLESQALNRPCTLPLSSIEGGGSVDKLPFARSRLAMRAPRVELIEP